MKLSLKSFFGRSGKEDSLKMISTHLLFAGGRDRVFERWVATPQSGDSLLWDVFHLRYKLILDKLHLRDEPDVIARGVSLSDAIRILEKHEKAHHGLQHVSLMRTLLPESNHYSRAGKMVEVLARRVSAQRIARMRRRAGGRNG